MGLLWLSLSIFALAWALNFSFKPRNPPLVNYDNEVYFNPPSPSPDFQMPLAENSACQVPNYILTPSTKEQLVNLIKKVAGATGSRKLRVVGSGHSWSPIAKSVDLQLSLCKFQGLVSIDKVKRRATFGGGTTLKEVNAILHKHGLALSQLGSISDQTVAGSIATGTHGSGVTFGNMATYVTDLELVTGDGELIRVSANDSGWNRQIFKAAQVHLGMLGVVTQVTFQCQPSFNLEETRSVLSLGNCLEDMQHLITKSEHVKMWVDYFSGKCFLFEANKTEEYPRDNPNPTIELIKNLLFEMIISVLSWFPSCTPKIMKILMESNSMPAYNRVDVSHKVFNIPSYFPVHNEAEVVVGVEDCAPAIKELQDLVIVERIPVNFITEIRFVQRDDILLSPNFHRDSCHITLCIRQPPHIRQHYFHSVYHRLADRGFKPRVHWGKSYNVSSAEVHSMYPKLKEFMIVRNKLDPHGIFLNQMLSDTFGIPAAIIE